MATGLLQVLFVGASIYAVVELLLAAVSRWGRRQFPWLILSRDERPVHSPEVVAKYMQNSFDPELGWMRKPGTSGEDRAGGEIKRFHIAEDGARCNPGFDGKATRVSVYGDSFSFCRLVDDDETWPHFLSRLLDTNVRNYGVGNYGLDQALLRLERQIADDPAETVVMGVVPETMVRIHSYWKHYFEYGNSLAFKPRFVMRDGAAVLEENCIRGEDDLVGYEAKLPAIQAVDHFYQGKFQRDLLRFPYLPCFLSRWRRHGSILGLLLSGALRGSKDRAFRQAFDVVLRENARVSSAMYHDTQACALLEALIRRFDEVCRAAGKTPILMILPQPTDLALVDLGQEDYQAFFRRVGERMSVLDLTDAFRSSDIRDDLYVDGPLGPHASARGNRMIAEILADAMRTQAKNDS